MEPANSRETTLKAIGHNKVSAIIRTDDKALAGDAMSAVVDGGFRLVEFTLTTPGALELVAEFSRRPDLIVGAGTVMTTALAQEAVAAGARFLVSPICDREVIEKAADLNVVSIPGAYTPLEMERAHRFGADLVKLFPAPAGGVDYIRSVRGPLPHLRIFPTAGATSENFTTYLDAGCFGVGFVRSLFFSEDLAKRDFDAIQRRAATIIERLTLWQSQAQGHVR